MNLVAADIRDSDLAGLASSVLSHHGSCCEEARRWLLMVARSFDFSFTDKLHFAGPTWLNHRYKWGPTQWPLGWCDAVRSEHIDCGVFAAFANEIFQAKGIQTHRAQVMLDQSPATLRQWRKKWNAIDKSFEWIGNRYVYHEVCAVQSEEGRIRIYDPSEGTWLDPTVCEGHNGVLGVKLDSPTSLSWGQHRLGQFRWVLL